MTSIPSSLLTIQIMNNSLIGHRETVIPFDFKLPKKHCHTLCRVRPKEDKVYERRKVSEEMGIARVFSFLQRVLMGMM